MKTTLSFRDPAGYVEICDNNVKRFVSEDNIAFFEKLMADSQIQSWMEKGILSRVTHREVQNDKLVVQHEKVFFPSYPYEWSPEMLQEAGNLTINIALQLTRKGWGLKDATPFNVLFQGPNPIFVDWLSIEERNSHDPLWLASSQFTRTFIYPLMANRTFGSSLSSIFLSNREGLECNELYHMCSKWQLFSPSFLSLVSLPMWLGKKESKSIYNPVRYSNPEKAQFVMEMHLKRQLALLNKTKMRKEIKSRWGSYLISEHSYSRQEFEEKDRILTTLLEKAKPSRVLDVGCNAGYFTVKAAKLAHEVVAIDIDPVVIGRLWEKAKKEKLPILPLVVDLARPTPAFGWDYREQLSFIDRAAGKFDLVMMLAVIHHLIVQERVPMELIAQMAHKLTKKGLLIEFVGTEDAMFKRVARGRDALYAHITTEHFEEIFSVYFEIKNKERIHNSHRHLYYMERK